MKKEVIIGIITGILANLLGVYLYVLIFSKESFDATINQALAEGYFSKIVTLGAILNLVAFFIYIKNKKDYRARGVLLATVVIAIAVLIHKFL